MQSPPGGLQPRLLARRLLQGGGSMVVTSSLLLAAVMIIDQTGVVHDLGVIFGSAVLGIGLAFCIGGLFIVRAYNRYQSSPQFPPPPESPPG